MPFYPMNETLVCVTAFWVKRMHLSTVVPEVLREARWWFSTSSSCPWGALAFAGVVLAAWCFTFGFVAGAVCFNSYCRRWLLQLARACIIGLEGDQGPVVDLRHRLARYRPTG